MYPNVFDPTVTATLKNRVQALTPSTQPEWGKMNVAQMLAHCNVAYAQTWDLSGQPGWFAKKMLTWFVKPQVVGPKPYPKNGRTAPAYLITDERDFAKEQAELLANLDRVQREGEAGFDGRESHSFGPLTKEEWSVLFYKHLDHHLRQFGV